MNQKNGVIIVSVMSDSRTFANRKELNSFVDSIPGEFSPLEYAAKQKRDALDAGITLPPSDPPAPKPPTRFDDRIAELDQEEEEAETVYSESEEAWLSRLQESRAEVPRRFHGARDNSTKLSCFHVWKQERAAELAGLEFALGKADRKLQRARARANALRIARDRWRAEEQVRVVYEGQEVSLAEFTELRKSEGM